MKSIASLALLLFAIVSVTIIVACGGGSSSTITTTAPITISVSADATSVLAGGQANFTATVSNDPSDKGVTWTVSCSASSCGSVSPTATLSGSATTYTAPGAPPSSDLTITVKATSAADSSKSGSATITLSSTIPPITVSITPTDATVDATGTVPNIVATVSNDPDNKGVNWSLSCSPAPCGSISSTSTLSGQAIIYTAPKTPPPGDLPVTLTATSAADPTIQSSIVITLKAISVVVTGPDPSTVDFGLTLPNIIAVVNDDPAHGGVTWAIQPCGVSQCGSISSNATPSGVAITYTAPPTPPANSLSVTIVATSDSDHNQQGTITITVPAISISVSPPSAVIPVGATAALNATPFTPTVNGDPTNQGVSWSLTQGGSPCSSACGTITDANTKSGTATTYAAPATVPTNPSVTITATSVTDNTKQVSATITLTAGTVKLIPASLDFGKLKETSSSHPTKTLSVTLTNTGGSALNITGQTVTGTDSNVFSAATPCKASLPTSVASGSSCDISVLFHPPVAVRSYSAALSIADDDVTSSQQLPLSGKSCTTLINCRGPAIHSALARNSTPIAPTPTGPYRIGTQVVDLVDATRSDPYLANGAKRELLVRFWYPAAPSQGCRPAQYTSPHVWNYLAQLEKIAPPQVRTNSCQDAPIATGAHSMVVFTHGYTGTFTDYTFLFEDLASRGYVVASVNHTFEATAVEFPDGRLAKSLVGSRFGPTMQLDAETTSFAVAARLSDLKFVMDELGRMNVSRTSPFAGKLDLSHAALAGHSLGGMTALLGLQLDPRFRAAVSIDGMIPGPLFGTTKKPVLILFAGSDAWDQDTCRLWGRLQGRRFALNLKGSEHLTPSDAVWLARGAVQTGTVGMEKTVEAVRNYIAAFLDVNLSGKPSDQLLTGASSDYPDVEVTTQMQTPCGVGQHDLHK